MTFDEVQPARPTAPWRRTASPTRAAGPRTSGSTISDASVPSRFTFSPGFEGGLAPSPDGKTLYFTTETGGAFTLQRKEIGGSGDGEVVLESAIDDLPERCLSGRRVARASPGRRGTGYDIWILPLSGGAEPYPS